MIKLLRRAVLVAAVTVGLLAGPSVAGAATPTPAPPTGIAARMAAGTSAGAAAVNQTATQAVSAGANPTTMAWGGKTAAYAKCIFGVGAPIGFVAALALYGPAYLLGVAKGTRGAPAGMLGTMAKRYGKAIYNNCQRAYIRF